MTKRQFGTGGLFFNRRQGYWQARVVLADGRRVTRSRHTEGDAAIALDQLRDEYAGRLSYHYEYPRQRSAAPIRPAISKRTRITVFARDGYRCRYCGATAALARLVLDHFLPVIDGGTDEVDNLVTACEDCNGGKGDLMLPMPPPAMVLGE